MGLDGGRGRGRKRVGQSFRGGVSRCVTRDHPSRERGSGHAHAASVVRKRVLGEADSRSQRRRAWAWALGKYDVKEEMRRRLSRTDGAGQGWGRIVLGVGVQQTLWAGGQSHLGSLGERGRCVGRGRCCCWVVVGTRHREMG